MRANDIVASFVGPIQPRAGQIRKRKAPRQAIVGFLERAGGRKGALQNLAQMGAAYVKPKYLRLSKQKEGVAQRRRGRREKGIK
jgi:hypothetical protein